MKLRHIGMAAGLLLVSVSAQAEWFGAPSGRSADPANSPKLSVEGAFSTSGDYDYFGARLNYSVNEKLTVYGDVGQGEFFDDGTAFGAGLFYHLPNLSESSSFLNTIDLAAQGSYHTLGADIADVSAITVAMLFSPKTAMNPDSGLSWYGNVGFTRLTVDVDVPTFTIPGVGVIVGGSVSDSSSEIQIGGGVYLPMGPGTLYAGADLIDEFIFGVGYRYGLD
jgi:hypothetical protein